jgi:hypothetical protein
MGIFAKDLRELVVRPTLQQLNEWSPAAENLLLGTAAQESQLGFIIHTSHIKGAGLYRISEQTHTQVWDEFLITDPELASRIRGLASQQQFLKFPHHELITNLGYATGIAWMVYKRNALQLPDENDIAQLAHCWQTNYAPRDADAYKSLTTSAEIEMDKFAYHYRKLVLRENKKLAA